MKIKQLDHVNVRTLQMDVLINWYTDVLGMQNGKRPDFPFPGAWLYIDDHPMIHLVAKDNSTLVGSEAALKLEHFAFAATGLAEFEAHIKELGVKYERFDNEFAGVVQVNLWDPDDNHIHIDFPISEA